MSTPTDPPPTVPPAAAAAPDAPPAPLRLRRANRDQVAPVPAYLDALLPEDHLARLLWQAVERLDLASFSADLKVVEGGPGRAAADPAVLVTVWLFATAQGVTSARTLERLCVEHIAYIWICGGVTMNYHSLSDFRVGHGAALDALMTQVLGVLHHAGLVDFDHVAQDGIRVRASAGAASFRRESRLEQSLAEARTLLAELQATPAAPGTMVPSKRHAAARQRAARERVARLEAALAELPSVQAAKPAAEQEKARVSSTDPPARVMKMADGGFRPAYNIQLAADTAERVIVGVAVSNSGSDQRQAGPMVAQVQRRMGELPDEWLMDGGFVSKEAVGQVEAAGPRVLAPVPQPKDPTRKRYAPLAGDSAVVAAWRIRMGTEGAQARYKLRAATIECVNALARARHGLQQLRVRGPAKVLCVGLLLAVTHNLLIWVRWQSEQQERVAA
jgi:transposase